MTALHFQSAKQLAQAVRRKKISARELLEHFLARVERYNPSLNAIIRQDAEGARKRARAADQALARGKAVGPLHGVPMTIKESFDVVGMPTTWGVPEYRDAIATRNALAVERYLAAGVVLFGKSNVPVLLSDWQTFNPIYGTTNNPWDVRLVPGGSSGGSAAALAAGLTGMETGSDIGASIRNPAHYCGVYGHKPTYGICPTRGQALAGRVATTDISVIGPMGRSAEDLEIGLGIMAGPDEIDGAGYSLKLPAPRRKTLAGLKVAVMLTDVNSEVDQAVQARIQAVADFMAKRRAKVSDKARPAVDTTACQRVYIELLRAATSGRQTDEVFRKNQEAAAALASGDDSYFARMTRANVMPHRNWLGTNETRHKMRLAWAEFFKEWDVLICPTAATAAYPHDQKGERHNRTVRVNGRDVPTTDQLFWAGYSGVVYLPSTVAPAGFTPEGLPVGVQIIGPQFGDRTCIHVARLLESEFQGFVPPKGYD
ncbi:MAG: amidase [Alphaproteobacteria bacterium]|nr:amidase [Alphaproteobacteria bacterium]